MRGGLLVVGATLALVGAVGVCGAGLDIGEPRRLSQHGLERHMAQNPELESYVALRGYPDWAEEVEVDSVIPLDAHEVRIYYLRMNREVAFAKAFILGRPDIGLRLSERPIDLAMRDRILQDLIVRDPARRAELAAERAMAAADAAERGAESVEAAADRVDDLVADMEAAFDRGLYK